MIRSVSACQALKQYHQRVYEQGHDVGLAFPILSFRKERYVEDSIVIKPVQSVEGMCERDVRRDNGGFDVRV